MSVTPSEAEDDRSLHSFLARELAAVPAVAATQAMPPHLAALLNPAPSVFIKSEGPPRPLTSFVEVAPGIWRVVDDTPGQGLMTSIPGVEQSAVVGRPVASPLPISTPGYRPPWTTLTYMPPLVPFRIGDERYLEPLAVEDPDRLNYPWCTTGIVFTSDGRVGTGVLVGPNLLLTAGHVAPWGQNPWSLEFVPAYSAGTPPDRPFGSSFVESYHGYNTNNQPSGHDYIICKLYNPLGNALGWMGSQSWGNEDEYYARRYTSIGYPGSFADRPAVEFDMGLRDIDDANPGKDLEFSEAGHPDIGHGWSGGPLWLPGASATCVGVCSGITRDGLDPRFIVFAGGSAMVDLVKFGLANWPV